MSNSEEPKAASAPHVVEEEIMAAGKWVKLEKTTYVDRAGSTRVWETVKRTTRQTNTEADGVGIIALLKRTLHKDCVVLVKQFRPPMGCHTLEFPAVTCLDPGLSNCTSQLVMVNINGDEGENINPTQQLDLLKKEKTIVDAKVYIFAMGMVQAFFKPRELPVLKQ
ncbi:ADP-sugar pyrophosphatase [Liparis tanakae]|uniref:ADP-sugar pyrophosphatase n=1 Tax=Liparis tanakae TaxID=230148 RepID=A0A4Z2F4F4_9TELE|nr:ADP-sugar pyrophosphatase [Liparis tanakae]